ncbi:histidine triad (HIT) protein [mine drainage metagenome]|uniref:Histidine triad (HIT) protein n=1 Tax=mine drainage metagenome TaxID=410659 RepID=T1ADT0_9ZZZZ
MIAIMDINAVSEGHVLVIPKEHSSDIFDIAPELLRKSTQVAQEVAQKMKAEQGINSVNLLNCSGKESGQSVYHFHLHMIPRREGDTEAVVPKIDSLLKPK